MAKQTLQDAYISLNGTVLSDHANDVTTTTTADQIDFTTFSTAAYKQFGQGMKDATITATFFQDYAAGSVHSILQPLFDSGGTFALEVRPTSGARSATNPAALMTARLYTYDGISGKVGDALTFQATFQNAGTSGLTWATV